MILTRPPARPSACYSLYRLGLGDDGRSGFTVMRQDNGPYETLAHEVGHNFGCQHDRQTNSTGGFFNYSYGYREPGSVWKTLMAYPPGATILNYSNPVVNYTGPLGHPGPTGVPGNDANSSCNNALTIANTSWTLANFRASTLPAVPPARLHVRQGAPVNGSGASWADALPDLQAALCQAAQARGAVTQIWAAAGSYRPDRGRNDRSIPFRLVHGVAVYGGFAGTETSLGQRNPAVNVTILSGDIGTPDDPSDNSYHVLDGSDLDATALLDGVTISGGNANGVYPDDAGGGLRAACGGPTFVNCRFTGNVGAYGGALVNRHGGAPRFTNCAFSGNSATIEGGAAYIQAGAPLFTGCTFTTNTAPAVGAVDVIGSATPQFTSCTFSGNSADWGGAFQAYGAGANPSLTGCAFSGNHATNGGGAVLVQVDALPAFTQCAFNTNSAGFGAGLYAYATGAFALDRVTFTGNTANEGAGIYLYAAAPALTNCQFTANASGGSGSGSGGAVVCAAASAATLTGCAFHQNSAGCCGGAVASFGSTPTLGACAFVANSANYGAGAWFTDPGSPTLRACGFFGNVASYGGGAAHVSTNATPMFLNSVFSGNRAPEGYGGAFYNITGAAPQLINCSLSRNSAEFGGGGLFGDAAPVVLRNTILWANSDPSGNTTQASQLTAVGLGAPVVSYCDLQGWTGSLGGAGNFSGDPRFFDADGADNVLGTADDGLDIQPGSAAIDRGDNGALPAGATTDLRGYPRRRDDACVANGGSGTAPIVDLGAVEFQGASCASDVPSPVPADPLALSVGAPAPNPTAGSLVIALTLDRPRAVGLSVFDCSGRLVRRHAPRLLAAGPAELAWDGRGERQAGLAEGLYFVRIELDDRIEIRRVVLLR